MWSPVIAGLQSEQRNTKAVKRAFSERRREKADRFPLRLDVTHPATIAVTIFLGTTVLPFTFKY